MKLFSSPNGPPIRENDTAGRLMLAGYQWQELCWHRRLLLMGMAVAAIFITPVMAASGSVAAPIPAGLGILAVATIIYHRMRPRVIAFDRSGHILAPHGLPRSLGKRALPINHAAIISIEAVQHGEDCSIAVHTVEGETYIVSRLERSADARLVAVQLTKALHEMRRSLAVVPNAREVAGFGASQIH